MSTTIQNTQSVHPSENLPRRFSVTFTPIIIDGQKYATNVQPEGLRDLTDEEKLDIAEMLFRSVPDEVKIANGYALSMYAKPVAA